MQIFKFAGIFVLFLFGGLALRAQESETPHPVDAALKKCLETTRGTMSRAKCYSTASEAWQKAVAETYAALLKKVPAASKAKLETGQTAWRKYQAAEENLIVTAIYPQKGTGYISVRIIAIMKIYKDRAMELGNYLQSIESRESEQ